MGRRMWERAKNGSVSLAVAAALVGALALGACQTDENGATTDGLVNETPQADETPFS